MHREIRSEMEVFYGRRDIQSLGGCFLEAGKSIFHEQPGQATPRDSETVVACGPDRATSFYRVNSIVRAIINVRVTPWRPTITIYGERVRVFNYSAPGPIYLPELSNAGQENLFAGHDTSYRVPQCIFLMGASVRVRIQGDSEMRHLDNFVGGSALCGAISFIVYFF